MIEIAKKPKFTFLHFGTQIRTCAVKYHWPKFYTEQQDVNCEAGRQAKGLLLAKPPVGYFGFL